MKCSKYFLLLIVSLQSCSLLKLQPEFAGEPLPKSTLNMRMAVRSYYSYFSGEVIRSADSIIASTSDDRIKAEAIRWKIGATSACAKRVYQTDSEIALVDTWLLTKQMDSFITNRGDSLFGDLSSIASDCASQLYLQMDDLAVSVTKREKYQQLASFVEKQPVPDELYNWQFVSIDTRPLLIAHLQVPDSTYLTTVGTGAEVVNDFTDRISAYNEQIKSQLAWEKDLVVLLLNNDSIAEPYLSRIDSLSTMLNRLAIVAKESPEMMGIIAVRMREELTPVIHDFNSGMSYNLNQLKQEREALQSYFDEQRLLIRDDLQASGKELIRETTDNLIRLVKRVSWMIILLVIVLVAVFFGIPFLSGYYLAKAKYDKKTGEKNER